MRDAAIPEIPGVLSADQLSATVDAIAEWQLPTGMSPWFPGGHADPWNHIEAAMAQRRLWVMLDEPVTSA